MLLYDKIAYQKACIIQNNKQTCDDLKDTIKHLDDMLSYISEEIKLLQQCQSLMNASTHLLAHLQQMGNEFIWSVFPFDLVKYTIDICRDVSHLKDLKDDLNKIYGKRGYCAKIKKLFQSKTILDCIIAVFENDDTPKKRFSL